jgi:hypothetical protein
MMQGLGMTYDEVMYGHSYASLIMLSAAFPSYDFSDADDGWDESIDANIPGNFKV